MKKRLTIKEGCKILLGALAGLGIGVLIGRLMELRNGTGLGVISMLILILVSIYCSIFLHIIFHEGGHMVCGLLSGYRFVSFRVLSLTLVRCRGKFVWRRFYLPGTGGQCLMAPPDKDPLEEDFPYRLYNLGGVLAGILLSAVALLSAFLWTIPWILRVVLFLFAIVGLGMAALNGIPLKLSGIVNDGYHLRALRAPGLRWALYAQLKANALLSDGCDLADLPKELLTLPEGADVVQPMYAAIAALELSQKIARLDFEGAREQLSVLEPQIGRMIPLYQNELRCEQVFLEAVGPCRTEVLERLMDLPLRKYFQMMKTMPDKSRILMAYEWFSHHDREKAMEYYRRTMVLAKTSPLEGDGIAQGRLAQWVKERMEGTS